MTEFDLNGAVIPNDEAWVYDLYGMESITPQRVKTELARANGDDVVININSPGGDLYSAVNIYNAIQNYSGNIEVHIAGIAASAASVIAVACKCYMSPGSTIMIHNASCTDYSNKNGKRKAAEMLAVTDKAIAAVYEAKTGMSEKEILKLMDKETFLDAKSALDIGLIDGILHGEASMKIHNSAFGAVLPEAVIENARQLAAVQDVNKTRKDSGIKIEILNKILNNRRYSYYGQT